jgi:hypothetical protein
MPISKGTSSISEDVNEWELFASYFSGLTESPILIHRQDLGVEVIFGDSGILMGDDNTVRVRMHSDFQIAPEARTATLDWQAILGTEFLEAINEYRMSHAFSTSATFPIQKRLEHTEARKDEAGNIVE